ncbi:MAG: isoprenylcysteine carboxylmethyltransferase family protein [Candidatus Eremiobacteraeota bacterium]|nr:isoprenylcysteine carboxylmethyltransferase family protein [Candidatus Eremiobacteraeota bacterium]MCL5055312.1 isoprenylcysteine carboxylmethyltransferase family protein [Bacillota bacterium]
MQNQPIFFPSLFDQHLFTIVTYLFFLLEMIELAWINWQAKKRGKSQKKDRWSRWVIYLGIFISIFASYFFRAAKIALLPPWSFNLGIGFMILGLLLRQWAILTLGVQFSYTVQIRTGHQLITKGPYQFVRHPAYTGGVFINLGIGFAFQSWGAVLFNLFMIALVYTYRIRVEEKALLETFVEEYAFFCKGRKRILPFLI